jgi:hypothetical protein
MALAGLRETWPAGERVRSFTIGHDDTERIVRRASRSDTGGPQFRGYAGGSNKIANPNGSAPALMFCC